MPTQSRMSLKTIELNPYQFTPVEFKPQIADASLLQHAFDKREQRRKEAVEKASALENAFTQARSQLHNDPATMEWYRQYTQDMSDRMKNLEMFGDYSTLNDVATKMAGNFMENIQYTARAKRNQEYTEWEKAVDSSSVNQTKKDYYKDVYKYTDEDMFNENGDIIEGKKWNAPLPKGDLHWDTIYRQSAADVAEAVSGHQGHGGFTGDYTASTWQSGYETHAKALDKIVENVQEYFINNQSEWDKFEEDYKVLRWQYNNLLDARDKAVPGTEQYRDADDAVKAFISANSFTGDKFPDREELILQKMSEQNPYIKNFAYTRKTTNSGNTTTNKPASQRMGALQEEALQRELEVYDDDPEAVNGPSVVQTGDDNTYADDVMDMYVGRVISKTEQTMKKKK